MRARRPRAVVGAKATGNFRRPSVRRSLFTRSTTTTTMERTDSDARVATGVDLGSVHFAIFQLDVDDGRCLAADMFSMRRRASEVGGRANLHELGMVTLLDNYRRFFEERGAGVFRGSVWIEDNFDSAQVARDYTSREVRALQSATQFALGRERCVPIAASAIKRRFAHLFPAPPDGWRASRHDWNKLCAETWGPAFVDDETRARIDAMDEQHHAYDAMFAAMYGAHRLHGADALWLLPLEQRPFERESRTWAAGRLRELGLPTLEDRVAALPAKRTRRRAAETEGEPTEPRKKRRAAPARPRKKAGAADEGGAPAKRARAKGTETPKRKRRDVGGRRPQRDSA